MNTCNFSPCRAFRYSLRHRWEPNFMETERTIAWIGLNPSTADENNLDPTLTRIKAFSSAAGFNSFVMLNLFAFRATDPRDMKKAVDPIGPGNDEFLKRYASECTLVVCCWGTHGTLYDRSSRVLAFLPKEKLRCLDTTKDHLPKHPLYLSSSLRLKVYP